MDTHAHIFERGLRLASERRYAPDYDATVDDYLRLLDENHISNGVLVQPSFLGTDNSYLTAALVRHRDRLRGIAVVDPSTTASELTALAKNGIVGIRLNMVGMAAPDLTSPPWQALLKRVHHLNWLVEVQKECHDLLRMLPPLIEAGVHVAVDHFGRPDPKLGIDDPGFRYLLSTAASGQVWVKLSGAYRNGEGDRGQEIALQAMPLLRQSFGVKRLIWGSDWPHTQFEKIANYVGTCRQFESWVTDAAERRTILIDTPWELYRF